MSNPRILLGVLSLIGIGLGLWLLLLENQQHDCHKRHWGGCCDEMQRDHENEWCGRPDPGDLGWTLLIIGLGMQVIKCWVT